MYDGNYYNMFFLSGHKVNDCDIRYGNISWIITKGN